MRVSRRFCFARAANISAMSVAHPFAWKARLCGGSHSAPTRRSVRDSLATTRSPLTPRMAIERATRLDVSRRET